MQNAFKYHSYLRFIIKVSGLIPSFFMLLLGTLQAHVAEGQLLDRKIKLELKQADLKESLMQIESVSKIPFTYAADLLNGNSHKVTVTEKEISVQDALSLVLKGTDLTYRQVLGYVIIEVKRKEVTVNGIVRDTTGHPLPGVTIYIKGRTSVRVLSNSEGGFQISAAAGEVLVFTYLGYLTKEQRVDQNNLEVVLQEGVAGLDEVVVVGYGTTKRSDLTGAVTDVSADKLKDQPVASVDQQLVGRVAGVQIQQGSGAPGAGTSVQIRGSGSLGAGNDPLYVIDGMPYASESDININPMSFLNTSDIESISVLKDASSTAIYGSRGANGVIIITTKNAGKSTNEINASAYVGINQVPRKGRPKMMDAHDFAVYQRDRIGEGIRSKLQREPTESDYPVEYQHVESIGEGTNWYDLILRNAMVQNYTVDINKSVDRSRFYFGLGYYNQEGVIYNSGLKRFSATFNYSFNFTDKIRIDASLRPSYIDQDRVASGLNRDDPLSIALWANPVMSPYDENGNLIPYLQPPQTAYSNSPMGFPNPLFALENVRRDYNELRNLGNLSLQWQIIPGLRFKTALSTIYNTSNYNQFVPSTVGGRIHLRVTVRQMQVAHQTMGLTG